MQKVSVASKMKHTYGPENQQCKLTPVMDNVFSYALSLIEEIVILCNYFINIIACLLNLFLLKFIIIVIYNYFHFKQFVQITGLSTEITPGSSSDLSN